MSSAPTFTTARVGLNAIMFHNEWEEERAEKLIVKKKEKESHGDRSRAKAMASTGSSAMC